MKTKLYSFSEIQNIVDSHFSVEDIHNIMFLSLKLHLENTSASKMNDELLRRKIQVTKKILTTPYAINCAIENVSSL